MPIRGVDVSKWQGNIDWSRVKNSGIEFVIIRAGYGSSTVDERFEENIRGAIEENLGIGVYWFSYATSNERAAAEARTCMEVYKLTRDTLTIPYFTILNMTV